MKYNDDIKGSDYSLSFFLVHNSIFFITDSQTIVRYLIREERSELNYLVLGIENYIKIMKGTLKSGW